MRRSAAFSLSHLHQSAKQAAAAAEAPCAAADAAHAAVSAAARSASGGAAGFSGRVPSQAPLLNHTDTTPQLAALRSLHHLLPPSAASPASGRAAAAARGSISSSSRPPYATLLPRRGQAALPVMRPLATIAALAVTAPQSIGALHGNSMAAPCGARSYASQPIGRITPEMFTEKAWEVRLAAHAQPQPSLYHVIFWLWGGSALHPASCLEHPGSSTM